MTQKKPATYAELEALPPHLVGEIIDGELIRPEPFDAVELDLGSLWSR